MKAARNETIRVLVVAVLCLVLGCAVNVLAKEQDRPCKADVSKFCANVEAGEGRIMACLDKHKEELSPACKDRITNVVKEAKRLGSDCWDDITTHCPVTKPGEGRIISCLEEHERLGGGSPYGKLTPMCANKLSQLRKEVK
jgi:hypothetical protein